MVQVQLLRGYRRRGVGTTMEVPDGLADGLEAIGLAKRVSPSEPVEDEEAGAIDVAVEDDSVAEFNRLNPEVPEVAQ